MERNNCRDVGLTFSISRDKKVVLRMIRQVAINLYPANTGLAVKKRTYSFSIISYVFHEAAREETKGCLVSIST